MQWKCEKFIIDKYETQEDYELGVVSESEEYEGNIITLNGMTTLLNDFSNSGNSYSYSLDNTYLAIGHQTVNGSAEVTDIALRSMSAATSPESPMGGINGGGSYSTSKVKDGGININTLTGESVSISFSFELQAPEAVGAWTEWGIYNGDPGNPGEGRTNPTNLSSENPSTLADYNIVMLNHKIQDMGTKASGFVWSVTVIINLSNSVILD